MDEMKRLSEASSAAAKVRRSDSVCGVEFDARPEHARDTRKHCGVDLPGLTILALASRDCHADGHLPSSEPGH